ncbi:MAG: YqgE/AlgH family protein [Pirellulales bacterium]
MPGFRKLGMRSNRIPSLRSAAQIHLRIIVQTIGPGVSVTSSSVEGRALVASPYLTDPNFRRSVVFIIKHDDDGAYGLILNRPSNVTVGDLVEEVIQLPSSLDEPIYYGGPVDGPVVFLHGREDLNGTECIPGVYLSGDQKEFLELSRTPGGPLRVFSSYSGWGPGQLENELDQGGWLIWNIEANDIFSDPNEVCNEQCKRSAGTSWRPAWT